MTLSLPTLITNSVFPLEGMSNFGLQWTQYWYDGIFYVENEYSVNFSGLMFFDQTHATQEFVQQVSDEYHGIQRGRGFNVLM